MSGRIGPLGDRRFHRAFFPGALTGTGELLVFGHSLTGPLVGFAAAGGEEIVLFLCTGEAATTDDAGEGRREKPDDE